jgi:opacity protein-like surface antigen
LKKINTLIAILVIIFAVNGLKAQTYPVPKFNFHVMAGYTFCLPNLSSKVDFPGDPAANPTPYFIKNGFNFGADAKYYVDRKSTFGVMASLTYSMLSSGNTVVTGNPTWGSGTFKTDMNIFTFGIGAEYDFAPKRPANPFVNVQFTTNMFSGKSSFVSTDPAPNSSFNLDMTAAVRFGAMFGAGVDVKLSKNLGIVIGGRYAFANLFGKDSTASSSTNYGLNDKENSVTGKLSRKIAYLQFYAGMSFYFGMVNRAPVKKP